MTDTSSMKAQRNNSYDEFKRLVASKVPIIWIESWEEDQVEACLKKLSEKAFTNPIEFHTWTETKGWDADRKEQNIIEALEFFLASPKPGILLVKDFSWELASSHLLKRKLRDVFHLTKGSFKTLFLLSPHSWVPDDMLKEILTTEFALPDEGDIESIFDSVMKTFPKLKNTLSPDQMSTLVKGALGLTSDEIKLAFQKMAVGRQELNEDAIRLVLQEKARVVKRDGLLEYIPTRYTLADIGGLENMKEWLEDRKNFFSKDAIKAGLQLPKGVLMTGVSGCGKSLCSQAISAAWNLPIYRLDINRVYGGAMGTPEECFRRAIKQIESVAPAILWLEEIEKSVAGYEQGDKGVTARIFSSFLTWMQEHTSPVVVAATANEINRLPPELLRKGRFDEIFFVDLPSEKERADIFKVHLSKRSIALEDFNLMELAKGSVNFNGAEIEQTVISGLTYAFKDKKRKVQQGDLFKAMGRTVPLATTMSEQIKLIKRWADTRAVKASK